MTFAKSVLSIFEAENNRKNSVIGIKLDLNKKIEFPLKFIFTDKIAVVFFFIVFLSGGCKKEQSIINSCIISGTINLEVHSIHHTRDVTGISIYLKKIQLLSGKRFVVV